MKATAKRLFVSPIFGNVHPGDVITVDEQHYKYLSDLGLVEKIAEPKEEPKKIVKKTPKAK